VAKDFFEEFEMRVLHVPLRHTMLTAALAAAALLAGCGRQGVEQAHAAAAPPAAPEVLVAQVTTSNTRVWDAFNGRVEAVQAVQLRPRVSGYIERVAFSEGQDVGKGQLLFVIDQRPYRAALASAQAQLERARAAAGLARNQDERARSLVAGHAISREEAEARAAELAQAAAQVRAAEAALETARLNLEFTEVRAPVAGRAGRALLTAGNMAQADQSLLTSLVSQDPVYVYFDVDEHSYLRYQKLSHESRKSDAARAVRVGLAGEDGFAHEGVLDFTDNQLNADTGSMRLRARLANPERRLTPGLFARVQLQGSAGQEELLLIDDKAVLTDQSRQYAYVVEAVEGKGHVAQRRELKLGRMVDGKRVVEQGLNAGEQLVVGGLQRIYYPGMAVSPKAVAPAAPQGQPEPSAAAQVQAQVQ
jgi:multidrug efflux system membrane fusion protein